MVYMRQLHELASQKRKRLEYSQQTPGANASGRARDTPGANASGCARDTPGAYASGRARELLHQRLRAADYFFPVEGGAGVGFVFLDVVVADHALEVLPLLVGQDMRDEIALLVLRVGELNLGKHFREGGGEFDQRVVLLGSEVVLIKLLALDGALDQFLAGGFAVEGFGPHTDMAHGAGRAKMHHAFFVGDVPLVEHRVGIGISADAGDFDADRAGIRNCRVPGAFLEIERLVDRAVDVEHKMHAQSTAIVQDLKASLAGATDVVVHHELIDDVLQQRQRPTPTADLFELLGGQFVLTDAVAIGGVEVHLSARGIPFGLFQRRESALNTIGIVPTGIHPQHDGSRGVEELTTDDDLVAGTGVRLADFGGVCCEGEEWNQTNGKIDLHVCGFHGVRTRIGFDC